MKKVLFICFFIFAIIFMSLFYLIIISPENYKEEQNYYFNKVDYKLEGIVYKFKYLGGVSSLLYIRPESFDLKENNLQKEDDFIGLFSKQENFIVLVADFDLLMDGKYDSLEKDKFENIDIIIKVNSRERNIYYFKGKKLIGKTKLSTASVYKDDLLVLENKMKNLTRF
jgi:hypothetical protein